VTEDLTALEEGLADAIRRSDTQTASRFLANDFILSSTGGMSQHMPREEWLAALPQLDTRSLVPEILDSRFFGDVAVARVLVRWEAWYGERDMTGSYGVTDVFRQEDGGWRLAWRISVRMPDE
jgi:ketosteroid isomerase-like protein